MNCKTDDVYVQQLDPLHLLKATLQEGLVEIPLTSLQEDTGRGWDSTYDISDGITPNNAPQPSSSSLERKKTLTGNIVVIEGSSDDTTATTLPFAVWLQRKLGKTTHDGCIRLGYQLDPTGEIESTNVRKWELATDSFGRQRLVAVHILPIDVLTLGNNHNHNDVNVILTAIDSPMNELSALQRIARHNNNNSNQRKHVIGTSLVATSSQHVYAVVPYHRDGTLLQFCQANNERLPESLARFLFRQIVQGLQTLQDVGLCHRNLSMDAIAMDGDYLEITQLGWAMRYDFTTAAAVDDDDEGSSRRPPPPPGGMDFRCIAPEYFGAHDNHDGGRSVGGAVWDGFQADLWATGLILFSMVVSSAALFTAPISEDKSFHRLCIRGDICGQVERYHKLTGKDDDWGLSEDLVDLLRNMLRADPKQRLSLSQVQQHPWLTKEEIMTPTQWLARINLST